MSDADFNRDLLEYVKSILQTRLMPTSYVYLRELVKEAPSEVSSYADSKYPEEKFLNFLLSQPNIFNVGSDGMVNLIGSTQFILPMSGEDAVDCPNSTSDDNYFGDREEYQSDSEEDTQQSSQEQCLIQEKQEVKSEPLAKPFVLTLQTSDSVTSSDSYVTSEFDRSATTSDSNSHSSFESCPESKSNQVIDDNNISSFSDNLTSSTYSSCSDV